MYAFHPIYGIVPVPQVQPFVPVHCPQQIDTVPLAASTYGHPERMGASYGVCINDLAPSVPKKDIAKAVNNLVKMSKATKSKRVIGPPKPIETVETIMKRWIKEKQTKTKFWRRITIKKNQWYAVREMVRLMSVRYPGRKLVPAVGTRWPYILQGLMQVAQRFNMSARKLRNLTKVALGYRRSTTEETIDKPKDIYRFYGFDEAQAKKIVFESLDFYGLKLTRKRKRAS